MRKLRNTLLAVAAALAAGCGEGARDVPAPLDRFTFPTGLALAPLAGGGRALVVVSSNFDLRYSATDGGSVLVVDPDRSSGDALVVLGAARVPAFGGEAAVVSGAPVAVNGAAIAPATCPGWTGASEVLVPVRNENKLYRLTLDGAGALSCGARCALPLPSSVADPFAVQVVCRGPGDQAAFVSQLRAPNAAGYLSRVDLARAADERVPLADASTRFPLGDSPSESLAYDAANQRLYVTGRFAIVDQTPLRWVDLFFNTVQSVNLAVTVRGSEQRAIALSSDGTRAYVALRIFNRDLATPFVRPGDVSGALAVVDLTPTAAGSPSGAVIRLVQVGVGPNEVEVMPRGDGRRDVVAVTSTDEGSVTIYDDQAGAVATVLGVDASGRHIFGKQPFGLVSEPAGGTLRRLYVGSFDRGFVKTVLVDLDQPALARIEKQFGREVP